MLCKYCHSTELSMLYSLKNSVKFLTRGTDFHVTSLNCQLRIQEEIHNVMSSRQVIPLYLLHNCMLRHMSGLIQILSSI